MQPYQPVPNAGNVEMGALGNNPFKSPYPVRTVCPNCRQEGFTKVEHVNGRMTWFCCVAASMIFMCCIPLTAQAYKYRVHYCQRCQEAVGSRLPCSP